MGTTYLKRQKEMKRLEKQRQKAERRAQKKLAPRVQDEFSAESTNPDGQEAPISSTQQSGPIEVTPDVPPRSSLS